MAEDVGELLKRAVGEVLEEARRAPQPQNSHQTVTLHHADPPPPNPWQTWVCVTAAVVMFVMTAGLGLLFIDLSRKYDRMQDHLNAIYMMAPHLKPEPK